MEMRPNYLCLNMYVYWSFESSGLGSGYSFVLEQLEHRNFWVLFVLYLKFSVIIFINIPRTSKYMKKTLNQYITQHQAFSLKDIFFLWSVHCFS